MTDTHVNPTPPAKTRLFVDRLPILLILVIPLVAWWGLKYVTSRNVLPIADDTGGSRYEPSLIHFERESLSGSADRRPMFSHVQIIDFNENGLPDVLACDAKQQRIVLFDQQTDGSFVETTLVDGIAAPAHATVVDLDQDGDQDLVVAVLGDILPNDGVIGQVVWLENDRGKMVSHLLLDDVRRVADCQPGDLDGDGDIDLAIAVFGYARGQVLWLENAGNGRFRERELLNAPGTIHVPVGDFDGDGDLDITAIVSQEDEEIWGFENNGKGEFTKRLLWYTINDDIGSAGLIANDLDQDGDLDLLLPVGDNLEIAHCAPQAYHGCIWFENHGSWKFTPKRISDFGTTYACAVADIDGDGDRDVALVSMVNNWNNPANASVIWLENDGQQNFTPWQIDNQPTHRVTVGLGDIDNDGRIDIVAGGLHLTGPYDRTGGVMLWRNRGAKSLQPAAQGSSQ